LLLSLSISAFNELNEGRVKLLVSPFSSVITMFADESVVVTNELIFDKTSTIFLLNVITWSATFGKEV
jgi:hypothetical protein